MSFKDFCSSHRNIDHTQPSSAKPAPAAKQAAPAKPGDKAKMQAPAK
ncbi:MAG: hypothetical protein AB7D00_05655 [Rhodospirillaceae bacterium]